MLASVFTIPAIAAEKPAYSTGETKMGDTGDVEWSFDSENGSFILLGNGSMADYTENDESCPWYSFRDQIKSVAVGPGVEKIGAYSFYDCCNLENVSYSGSVLSTIGNYAFAYTAVKEFHCPAMVDYLGKGAFYACFYLADVTLSNNITEINHSTFTDCAFKNITIPDSVTTIREGAFRDCANLETVNIPAYVTKIDEQAFGGCTALQTIDLSPINNNYYGGNSNAVVEQSTDRLIVACNNTVIPPTVKSIAAFAFEGLEGIQSIDLPTGMTEIENYTFRGCTGLKNVVIPDNITKLGMGVFEGCYNMISILIPKTVTYIDLNAFNNTDKLAIIYYTGSEAEWDDLMNSRNGKYLSTSGNYYNLDRARKYFNYDPNHAHVYGEWFTWRKATMSADGERLRECSLCGDMDSQAIPKIQTVKLAKTSCTYTGKAIKPVVTIKDRTGKALKNGTDFTLTYSKNKAIGTATVKVSFKGDYSGSKNLTFKINKMKNTMTAKGSTKTVKFSKVKKAKQTVKKAITVKKAKGAVTYAKVSKGSSKALTISKKGVITVKKGTKKGTYKIKVKVTAKGNKTYSAITKTVTVKIKVK